MKNAWSIGIFWILLHMRSFVLTFTLCLFWSKIFSRKYFHILSCLFRRKIFSQLVKCKIFSVKERNREKIWKTFYAWNKGKPFYTFSLSTLSPYLILGSSLLQPSPLPHPLILLSHNPAVPPTDRCHPPSFTLPTFFLAQTSLLPLLFSPTKSIGIWLIVAGLGFLVAALILPPLDLL